MTLAVVGTGLVSPAGMTPAEHAFFVRAGVVPSTATPYRTGEDEPVYLRYCPWLGAHTPPGERAASLVQTALEHAMEPPRAAKMEPPTSLLLCLPAERPGFRAAERADVERAAKALFHKISVERFTGAAGAFAALSRAEVLIGKGAAAVVIVAVDTFASIEAMEHAVLHPPSHWSFEVPSPSECAAALVVTSGALARRHGVDKLGYVHGSAIASSSSNDDNDEPVDGTALTQALAALPGRGPVKIVFGQFTVDRLRMAEWQISAGRSLGKVDLSAEVQTLEREIGRIGAAAGAASLVYGLAVQRHETHEKETSKASPFLAWAISRDGTRGAAIAGLSE